MENYADTIIDQSGIEDFPEFEKLFEVAAIIDEIYHEQYHHRNEEARKQAEKDPNLLEKYKFFCGPFDKITDEPFIEGHKRLPGANLYPADMTKEEFEEHIKNNPKDEEAFKSTITKIERQGESLVAVPYSEAYKEKLSKASQLLIQASEITKNESLKDYLSKLAEAFMKNDYYESNCAWIDLDSDLEVQIGPFEVYDDELFGYKAVFEALIAIKDKDKTDEIQKLESLVPQLEENLPYESKTSKQVSKTPLIAVKEIISGGDLRAGVHTTAFNLPNDEKVREDKGTKKVMLLNISKAKYKNCTDPIYKEILDEETYNKAAFEPMFEFVLLHEISHGIGPGFIQKDGEKSTVNAELKEQYSSIEELKADTLAVYNAFYLNKKGIYTEEYLKGIIIASIAGTFRSIRFGIKEAHGASNITTLNWMKEKNVLNYNEETKKYHIDFDKAKEAYGELTKKVLNLQETGDYEGTKEFFKKYKKITPDIKETLENLKDVPIDINPIYSKDFR